MRKVLIVPALFLVASCFNLKKGARPVFFSADSTVFADSLFPEQAVYLNDFYGIMGDHVEDVELRKGEVVKGFALGTTLIGIDRDKALIYPREHILVKGSYDDYHFTTVNGSEQRNRELMVFKVFKKLEKRPVLPQLTDYTLQSVLALEQQQKEEIAKAEARSQLLFDSLLNAYAVSEKFKELTKGYISNRYDFSLIWIYETYRDTLKARGLYRDKYDQLLAYFNNITTKEQFNSNVRLFINQMYPWRFPGNSISSISKEDFRNVFDTVENNFSGLARDYLLSVIMYRSYSRGINIPKDYVRKYKHYSINKDYRKMVRWAKGERKRSDADTRGIPSQLLTVDGKEEVGLEKMLAQQKGKYVFVDLWASWCGPCLKQIPYLKQLEEKYPPDKIAFLSISLDKSTFDWRKALRQNSCNAANNYLLLNAGRTSFYRQYNITTIPRFLLFDKEGKILNTDAPPPDDPALRQLLDELIYANSTIQ